MKKLPENLYPPTNMWFDDISSGTLFVGGNICERDNLSSANKISAKQPTSVQYMFVHQQ